MSCSCLWESAIAEVLLSPICLECSQVVFYTHCSIGPKAREVDYSRRTGRCKLNGRSVSGFHISGWKQNFEFTFLIVNCEMLLLVVALMKDDHYKFKELAFYSCIAESYY